MCTSNGFDFELVNHIHENVTIYVIVSIGARKTGCFSKVFEKTDVEGGPGCQYLFIERKCPLKR